MKLERRERKSDDGNLIPLINVVFLMLVFFLAAGSLRPFEKEDIDPAKSEVEDETTRPTGPVMIHADGRISIGGVAQTEETLAHFLRLKAEEGEAIPLPIVADGGLAADKLVDVIEAAKQAGLQKIRLVTRRRAAQ